MSVGVKFKDLQQPPCSLTGVCSSLSALPALSGGPSRAAASPSRRPLPRPVRPPDWEQHGAGFGGSVRGTPSVEPDPRQPLSKHCSNRVTEHPALGRAGAVTSAPARKALPEPSPPSTSPAPGRWRLLGLDTSWAQPWGAAGWASRRLSGKVAARNSAANLGYWLRAPTETLLFVLGAPSSRGPTQHTEGDESLFQGCIQMTV